jgi:NAD(P)-dependent dehydrogenase (short-subunit alcohol dehydrogenase family)
MGRDAAAGASIVQEMEGCATADESGAKPTFNFVRCDASLLRQIKSTVDNYTSSSTKLDLLVLTQGLATLDGFTPTEEGIDRKLAVHYFGRAAFMYSLAPFMARTSRSPVIMSVLSGGVHSAFAGYKADMELKSSYSLKNAADAAGFYNDIAVDMISRENPDVRTIHSAPGVINTNIGSDFPAYLRYPVRGLMAIFGKSPADCAEVQLAPVFKYMDEALKASTTTSTSFKKGGFAILNQGEPAPVTPLHTEAADFVWTQSKEIFKKFM